MRSAALLSLALFVALAVLPVQAQTAGDDVSFSQASYARAGWGDLPRTAAAEPADLWNVVEYRRVEHNTGTESTAQFRAEEGVEHFTVDCQGASGTAGACGNLTVDGATPDGDGYKPTETPGMITVHVPSATATGTLVVSCRHSHAFQEALGFSLWFETPDDASLSLYVRPGQGVASEREAAVAGLASTDENPGLSIWRFDGTSSDPFYHDQWFVVYPGRVALVPADTLAPGPGGLAINPWLMLAVGVVLGAIVWALLVSRGAVQAKARKQVVSTAAHVEAAANDPPAVLEGRKRALLAALKEIEVAKMNNEMPNEVYDAVKADLKKQAVTVMRALETAQAAGESKA
jgi:hypothetical protein